MNYLDTVDKTTLDYFKILEKQAKPAKKVLKKPAKNIFQFI